MDPTLHENNPIKQVILKNILQLIKFGIVGISNTLVSLLVYYLLIFFNVNYIIANTAGFIVGVLNAYYWSNRYVFHSLTEKGQLSIMIKVFMSYWLTFMLNTGLLFLMIAFLDISRYVAPIIILFIITPINFLLNKYWAFK